MGWKGIKGAYRKVGKLVNSHQKVLKIQSLHCFLTFETFLTYSPNQPIFRLLGSPEPLCTKSTRQSTRQTPAEGGVGHTLLWSRENGLEKTVSVAPLRWLVLSLTSSRELINVYVHWLHSITA
jgi:hypothetical protein